MFLIFFLLWIIFNGQITLEIVLFGLVIAAAVYAFICKFMDYSWHKDKLLCKKSLRILQYIVILIWEIIKANMAVIKILVSPKSEPHPAIIHFNTTLKTKMAKVLLANSITLTPGTITVSLEGDELVVHCLDKSMGEGIEDSIFVHLLEKLEAEE